MAVFVFTVGEPMVQTISMESMQSVLTNGVMSNRGASATSNSLQYDTYSFQTSYLTLNFKSRK